MSSEDHHLASLSELSELERSRKRTNALLVVIGVSIVSLIAIVVSMWATGEFKRTEEIPPYAPISFLGPTTPVVNTDGSVPDEDDQLPAPSFIAEAGKVIPVRVTRYVDCAAHECQPGAFAVVANVWLEEINTDGIPLHRINLVDGFETAYDEGEDYRLGALTPLSRVFETIQMPQEMLDYLEENDKGTSAWRIQGTTTPQIGENVRDGTYVSEVFHVRLPGVGDEQPDS